MIEIFNKPQQGSLNFASCSNSNEAQLIISKKKKIKTRGKHKKFEENCAWLNTKPEISVKIFD